MRRLILAGCLLVLPSCNRNTVPPESSDNPAPTSAVSSEDSDRQAIEKLEANARSIVKPDGCTTSSDCRAAPIGARGCGGPRDFIVYCMKITDSVELARRIATVDSAEKAFNTKYNVMSTCELRLPPVVVLSGGSCVASAQ